MLERRNPFLNGNYAPIVTEDEFFAEVTGTLPRSLNGRLLRIGPNPQFPAEDYFWFNGDGMVHCFDIEEGRVRYANRFVRTPKYVAEQRLGRALAANEAAALKPHDGIANTNVLKHGGRILALEENHPPFEIDAALGAVGYGDWGGAVTAHPKLDPLTGEMAFFAYAAAGPASNAIDVGVADARGMLRWRERFEAPYSSMIHDCFLTLQHLVIPVLPLCADLDRAASGLPLYAWDDRRPALLALKDRANGAGEVIWIEAPKGYVFHTLNAFEADGRIIADTFVFARAPLFADWTGAPAPALSPAYLERWTIDLKSRTLARKRLDERPGEFPRMDERHLGGAYRHGWFAGQVASPGSLWFDSLRHVDLERGEAREWIAPAGDAVSEPVFVAQDQAEGDGWILLVAYRGANDVSELLVFNAQAVDDGPIAAARLPRRVPFGFHGNWIERHA